MNTFFHEIRVRWSEVDAQQVVFNGHYFNFFDISFNEFFRDCGLNYGQVMEEFGCDFFVKKATIEYHAPALFDQVLRVYVEVQKMGNSSMVVGFDIRHEQTTIASGELVYVCFDMQSRQPATIPEALRTKFRQRV
jgi:acyl-CoA thioester hydrolase